MLLYVSNVFIVWNIITTPSSPCVYITPPSGYKMPIVEIQSQPLPPPQPNSKKHNCQKLKSLEKKKSKYQNPEWSGEDIVLRNVTNEGFDGQAAETVGQPRFFYAQPHISQGCRRVS